MNGQLWQECGICGCDPVCGDCERCRRHCRCGTEMKKQVAPMREPEPYRRGIGAGMGPGEDGD